MMHDATLSQDGCQRNTGNDGENRSGIGWEDTQMKDEMIRELIEHALMARERSYSPYSGFSVGAALLTTDGAVYLGCNIENASYGATNCAERTAFFNAIADGRKRGDFSALAIVGGQDKADELCPPCGICRQVISEFTDRTFPVILGKENGEYTIFSVEELLPMAFEL